MRTAIDSIQTSFGGPQVAAATDSLYQLMHLAAADSSYFGYLSYAGDGTFNTVEVTMSQDEFMLLTPSEIVEKKEIKGWFNQYQAKQLIRITRIGLNGVAALMGQLVWGLALLVPFTALLLKIVYIRRKRKYVEHFIFSLHVHSFYFLIMFFGAIELYFFATPYIVTFGQLIVAVYFVLALKAVYQQNWWKTLLSAWVMSFGYLGLVMMVTMLTILVSVFLF